LPLHPLSRFPPSPAAREAFWDDLTIGKGRYERVYERRARELVVHFRPGAGVTPATMDAFAADHGLALFTWEQNQPWFRAMRAAGRLWITVPVDAELRTRANEIRTIDPARIIQVTPVYEPGGGDYFQAATPLPGQLVVRIASGAEGEVIDALAALGVEHRPAASRLLAPRDNLFVVADDPDTGFDLVHEVRSTPGVMEVEFDWVRLITFHGGFSEVPPDDYYYASGQQWGLLAMNMEKAGRIAAGRVGVKVTVAVVDSGFDLAHEDLPIAANGRLDAERLWETDVVDPAVSPQPRFGDALPHGTAVAGLVGATTGNAIGVASVAGDCDLLPIRLGPMPSAGQLAVAVGWVLDPHQGGPGPLARVISMSLTTPATSGLIDVIGAAAAAGLVLCAATGNTLPQFNADDVGFPAWHRDVIGVGAAGEDCRRYAYEPPPPNQPGDEYWESCWGRGLDVVAPGVRLVTTDISDPGMGWNVDGKGRTEEIRWNGKHYTPPWGDQAPGRYFFLMNGTSGATPHVAGVAALLLALHPALSAGEVRNIIALSARRYTTLDVFETNPDFATGAAPWNRHVGHGFCDCGAALESATGAIPPVPDFAPDVDPCLLPDLVTVEGYLGLGPGTTWRVFLDESLGRWVEVGEEHIYDDRPAGPRKRRVFVAAGAPVRRFDVDVREARAPTALVIA